MIPLNQGYRVKNDPPVLAVPNCETKQPNANLVMYFLYLPWLAGFRILVLDYMQIVNKPSLSILPFLLILRPASFACFLIPSEGGVSWPPLPSTGKEMFF